MTHKSYCEKPRLIIETVRRPEDNRLLYRERCQGCGASEALTEQEAKEKGQAAGHFIPTRSV